MNVRLYRFVDRVFGPPICAALSALDRIAPHRVVERPRKILVILLSEMGSQVLASPMFARLKERYPDASLHLLLFARNRETVQLLGLVPEENVIALEDRSFGRMIQGAFGVLRTLRSLRADVVIDCELFARLSSILSFLSGAPVRVGFHRFTQEGLYRGSFVTRPVLYNPYLHISEQFLTLADAIESESIPSAKRCTNGTIELPGTNGLPEAEIDERIARLHQDFPAIRGKSLVLVYASGGILPIRAWPLEHFQRLCACLVAQGHAVGVIGLPSDAPLGESIVKHCGVSHCVNLCGYTDSMRHLLALFHRASLLVANDGAPGQFAAITTLPTILLFGPETPALYAPLTPNIHTIYLGFSCSPCLTAYNHRNSPCDGDNQCLKQIAVERVLQKAWELLGAPVLAENRAIH
ncbi:MAG TPA: glycosyltransferase family 9 protein [Candidatus Saccharimonadales bacterium]|nr:glycosyltransferase family 9 protein [Candidatus Saccharimonadales bacterium]